MLIMLLASQLSAPVPDTVSWVRGDDYPMQYAEAGRTFDIALRATIRADGAVQGCSIEKSSGEAKFDRYNCGLLLSRVKFRPATDTSGQPTIGVYRTRVHWMVDYRKPKPDAGDIELTIAKLPAGLKSPTWIDLALAVDAAGKPSDCASGKPDQNAALVKAACSQLARAYRAIPARLPNGEPVASVQTAKVSFLSQ